MLWGSSLTTSRSIILVAGAGANPSDIRLRVIFINEPASTLKLDSLYTTVLEWTTEGQISVGSSPAIAGGDRERPSAALDEDDDDERTHHAPTEDGTAKDQLEDVRDWLLDVFKRNPDLASLGVELFRFFSCSHLGQRDKNLVMGWLSDLPLLSPTEFHEQFSKIDERRPDSIYEMMLNPLASEPSTSSSSIGILDLVALAFRTLTYHELIDVEKARIQWETGYVSRVTHKTSLMTLHPGFFVLYGIEVRLKYPEIRRHIFSYEGTIREHPTKDVSASHARFAVLCAEFLTSSHEVELLERTTANSDDVAALENRTDFLSYAVQYWLKHFSHSSPELCLEQSAVQKLLSDASFLDRWARVYWHRTSSATQPSLERTSALAIIAENGPTVILQTTLKAHAGKDWIKNQHWNALLAAARSGRSNAVRILLKLPTLDLKMFDLVLQAALHSDDDETMALVISKAPEGFPSSTGITPAIHKALELREETLITQSIPTKA
jgi:hypothetical protein